MLLFILISFAMASDCKDQISIQGNNYCYSVEWTNSNQKVDGEFIETQHPSPHLIPMKEMPQKWLYSNAKVKFWKTDDNSQVGQEIQNLQVLPFMYMANGHNHSTSHNMSFNSGVYFVSHMALHQMKGCWSLNGKLDGKNIGPLKLIKNFKNLTKAQNQEAAKYCENIKN